MALEQDPNYNALSWVQTEIQQTLEDASNELTAYTLNSEDQTHLISFVGHMHQIVGTIEMLNLPGAMMLATEMQHLTLSVRDQRCPNPASAQESLGHAIEIFENYLALLESGTEDHPLKLIDIINKLRQSNNVASIEAASLLPDVSTMVLPDTISSQNITGSQLDGEHAIKLRHAFQKSFLLWFRNDDAHALLQIGNVIHHLRLSCSQDQSIKFWWVAGGLIEAIAQNGLAVTNDIKLLIGKLSQPIKSLTEKDEDFLLSEFPQALLNDLLLLVAKASSRGLHVLLLKQHFKLNFFDRYQHQKIYGLETEEDDENRSIVFAEIEKAKSLISENEYEETVSTDTVAALVASFNNIATSLEFLSETATADFIKEQVSNTSLETVDDSTLASFVNTILQIEAALQATGFNQTDDSFTPDARQLQSTVVKECLLELTQIKDALTEFSEQAESNPETLNESIIQLELMSGSLSMLNYSNSAHLLSSTASVINKLVTQTKSVNSEQLLILAESIAAIEVFLEGIIQHGNPLNTIILNAQARLDHLDQSAKTDGEIKIHTSVTAADTNKEGEIKTFSFADDIDPEIAEIFIEEATEVLEDLYSLIPVWQQKQDADTLSTIRRHFHTLKGSGRMAGATVIGDLSWEIEELLNKLINEELKPNQHIGQLVEDTCSLIPKLVKQFENGQSNITDDVAFLLTKTRALTEAENVEPEKDGLQVIFNMEATQQLNILNQSIPADQEENIQINEDMLRAAHSLMGCANIEGVTLVAPATTQLDLTLRKLYEKHQAIEGKQVQLFEQILSDLSATVEHIKDQRQSLPDLALLEANITRLMSESIYETAEAATGFAIDPDLLAIFMDETDDLLAEYMVNAESWYHSPEDESATEALRDKLRSLIESAALAKIMALRDIYLQMDQLITLSSATDNKCLVLLDEAHEQLNKQMESLLKGEMAPSLNSFNAQVDGFLSAIKAEKPTTHKTVEIEETFEVPTEDEELLEVFIEESVELLITSSNAIKRWEKSTDDQIALEQLQRSLHTLKGGARLTGISPVADLAHHMETLVLSGVGKDISNLDSNFFVLLHSCQDQLSEMQEHLVNHLPLQYASNLIADIARFTEAMDSTVLETTTPASSSSAPVLEKESATKEAEAAASPPSQPIEKEPVTKEAEASASSPSQPIEKEPAPKKAEVPGHIEQIRVRADLLDYLSNYAGEVSISRDRVSQQNVATRNLLNEMEQTVNRLQEQLRNMEIETETQILFRYEDENTNTNVDFDPLELDRFSMIQQLSRGLTESVSDLNDIRQSISDLVRDTDTILLQQSRITTELQQGLMSTRLLPFDGIVPRLERIVRQTNKTLGKQSSLTIIGVSQELDRTVLDRLTAPIEHLLRNAIAHGIETSEERLAAGKNKAGNITLSIKREGSEIVFDISDDGQGINIDKVRKIAVAKGLIEADQQLTEHELIQFILAPGFSTSDEISQLAGRGIGMDVVANEIRAVKGRLTIDSTTGAGTTFHIRLPLTLSVIQALLVGCHDQLYAIPLSSVSNVAKTTSKERQVLLEATDAQYEYKGESYQFMPLATLLDQPLETEDVNEYQPILLFRSGDQRIALLVSHIESNREIVIKSLGIQLGNIAPLTGATILGDGQVAFILDIPVLAASMPAVFTNISAFKTEKTADIEVQSTAPVAMIVDDSITMRKASGNLLIRHGFEVITARDGIDAVAKIHEQKPDIILLDVEMPRMDGYEFATLVRNDAQFKDLPIIMITSRTGDKHRQRAMDIGVNAYLGKPYPKTELIENMQQLLGERFPHAQH